MNEIERKLYDYAVSVDWDCSEIGFYLGNLHHSHIREYKDMEGFYIYEKVKNFIEKHKPKGLIMKKEEVYLDLTKLTSDELKQVAESVKNEMFKSTYYDLSKGINYSYLYLVFNRREWVRDDIKGDKKEITLEEFLNNFGSNTITSITLPIEDYNRLRKLEIKAEIKRLRKEYKSL